MGLFSKRIPRRKFLAVTRAIAGALREQCDPWFRAMMSDEESIGVRWRTRTLAGEVLHHLNMLQLSVVACSFRDGGFLQPRDSTFILEWLCGLLTGDVPRNVRSEIERFLQYGRPDTPESLRAWASAVAPLIAEPDSGQTANQLEKWLPLVVSKAMIATYEACGDERTARKFRTVWTGPKLMT